MDFVRKLNILNIKLEAEENKLKFQANYSLKVLQSMPFPCWVKALNPENQKWHMVFVNSVYELSYNIKAEDYVLNHDTTIWGEKTGLDFEKADEIAFNLRGEPYFGEEFITHPTSKKQLKLNVVKWALVIGSEVVGVAGMVLQETEI